MHIQLIWMKPSSLNDNIIWLCGEFSHRFSLALNRRFSENGIDITPEQFSILVVLWYRDGITQKEISEQLNRDKTTIARVVNNMKKTGTVKHIAAPVDKRAKLIYLTKKGRALQENALKISGAMYMGVLQGAKPKQLQTTIKLLQQMLSQL